jgi:predicted MFS family arabinose efflux permease
MAPSHALPRSLVLLLALAAGQAVAGTFYAQPLLDAIAASFGIAESSAGVMIAATQVGYAAGLVLLVPLGDVVDRRRLILLQLVLGALALATAGAAGSGALLLAAMAGVGLFAVVIQLLVVHAASLTPEAQRGEVVGAVTSGVVLGILQARALAGPVSELGDWRTVYLAAAGLTVLVVLVLLRRLPAGDHRRTGITYGAVLRSLPALYADERPLRVRGALALLVFAALSVVWSSLVLPLTAPPHSLSHASVGLFGLAAIAGAVAARRAGRLADRGQGERTTGLALGLLVVAWLPLALIDRSLAAVAAGLVLVDVAVQAVHVTNQSMIYAARPEARSRLAGAYMVFYSVGIGGGSVASTATYAAAGWTAVCALGAAFSLAALVVWTATVTATPRWRPAADIDRSSCSRIPDSPPLPGGEPEPARCAARARAACARPCPATGEWRTASCRS